MKVIKRDGKMVEYDKEKIFIAVSKANEEIPEEYRCTEDDIKKIIKYIESLNKKRILVEDIQDIIELKLMEMKHYELAKHYIVYRYNRALVRKSNTTDDSLLSIIRNGRVSSGDSSLPSIKASYQREYIACAVSKDLTKRLLLPEKIVKSHEDGLIYFHDMEYFMQPIFDASLINIKDMLDNHIMINNHEVNGVDNFLESCAILTESISNLLHNQYGGLSIDISALGKYIKLSQDIIKKKYKSITNEIDKTIINEMIDKDIRFEITEGVKLINYQINTILDSKFIDHDISFLINLDKDDKYLKENIMLFEEIIKYKLNSSSNDQPRLLYVLNNLNSNEKDKYYYLTENIIKCAKKGDKITFISGEVMKEKYGTIYAPLGHYKLLTPRKEKGNILDYNGRFIQGIVSLNLAQLAIIADGNEVIFYDELNNRLDIIKEALLCRYHSLSGCTSDISPIHYQNGAISRLQSSEKIDEYLKNEYSELLLGIVGLNELVKCFTNESIYTSEGTNFASKVLNYINTTINNWVKETNIGILLYSETNYEMREYLYNIDLEKYGKVKNITNEGVYNDILKLDNTNINELENIKIIQNLIKGGCILKIDKNIFNNEVINKLRKSMLYFELESSEENE